MKKIFFFYYVPEKDTKDLNNPDLNGSGDIHLGLSTTMTTMRKRGRSISLTDLARKEKEID